MDQRERISASNLPALPLAGQLAAAVSRELHLIARLEEEEAATAAALSPYWAAVPPEVVAHRAAARALREAAFRIEQGRTPSLLEAS